MKTTVLTLITALTLTLGTTAFAAAKTDTTVTLTNITTISKIEAHGNVEVFITNGNKDGVKVYNNYYATGALVQVDKGVLRIANYNKAEKLIVEVTVTDLRNVAAYDNAVIKSDRLSLIDLKVDLYNQAYAGLQLNSYATTLNVHGQAKADVSGNVELYTSTYGVGTTINRSELTAQNAEEKRIAAPAQKIQIEQGVTLASI
jgi:hypothetical protein